MNKKDFNIVIVGIGGQGLITITRILAEAALLEGLDLKTSELHGLSQRGGSVETSLRFGPKIYSSLVKEGGANLIISLELQEALKSCYYASRETGTLFLMDEFSKQIPGEKIPKKTEILKELQGFSKKTIMVPATNLCEEKLGKAVLAGVFMISLASFKNLVPLRPQSILKAIKKQIPGKYLELNLKAFNLARQKFSLKI